MLGSNKITIVSDKRKLTLNVSSILYVLMKRNMAAIHTVSGEVYETRLTLAELEKMLGDGFLKVSRGTLVSVMAVHDVGDRIELNNGESLDYTVRNKKEIISRLSARQKTVIRRVQDTEPPNPEDVYHAHYRCFDDLPIAFTDIEMIFDDEKRAVDWRFCYANQALAELENVSLDRLVGATFGSLFHNMSAKWLRLYERATLYGETLEAIDHSPEIGADLRVTCFPTFKGHCGCLLTSTSGIQFARISPDGPEALLRYFQVILSAEN